MSDARRSPLHLKALTADDLTVDRHILLVDRQRGVQGECIVTEGPHTSSQHGNKLVVTVEYSRTGMIDELPLDDLGVSPYDGGSWSFYHYVLDVADRAVWADAQTVPPPAVPVLPVARVKPFPTN